MINSDHKKQTDLKAELEKANKLRELNDWYERFNDEAKRADALQQDRDHWRSLAEKLARAMTAHLDGPCKTCEEALHSYDQALEERK